MRNEQILDEALKLSSEEKLSLVDGILRSLHEPDVALDAIWSVEAEKRLLAYRAGKLKGIPLNEVFRD